jgi:hypothetical protein
MVEIGQNQISNLIFTPNSWSYECYTFFGKVLIHPHVCVCVCVLQLKQLKVKLLVAEVAKSVLFFPSRLVDDVMQMNVPSESVDIVVDKALNANHCNVTSCDCCAQPFGPKGKATTLIRRILLCTQVF